ncbi:MAG TPA: lipase family protein [Thermoanaerobaculia bacterium]|jgi:hypothetical protein|nr:lipase family protein [Thermoanaerobaculia bacterium]
MRTFPYDDSPTSLFHPERATDFFQHGPVRTDDALCAEMARLAYVRDAAALRGFLQRAGFSLVDMLDVEGSQAFIADDASRRVISFRGTQPDDPKDIFVDARFLLVSWERGGRAHEGWIAGLRPLRGRIDEHAQTPLRLLLTGHSLGAALATLTASLHPPHGLHTFGSPLVGDEELGRTLDGVTHHRYVDCCDLVTRLPPAAFAYRHTGERRFLDREGTLRPAATDDDIRRECRGARTRYLLKLPFLRGKVATRDLADHAPVNYVSALLGLLDTTS